MQQALKKFVLFTLALVSFSLHAGETYHASCLETLGPAEIAILKDIQNQIDLGLTDAELGKKLFNLIDSQNISLDAKYAITSATYGNLLSKKRAQELMNAKEGELKWALNELLFYGGRLTEDGLDLTQLKVDYLESKSWVIHNPAVIDALKVVFPESKDMLSKMDKQMYHQPIPLGNQILMPKTFKVNHPKLKGRIITSSQYVKFAKSLYKRFAMAMEEYLVYSRKSQSASELIKASMEMTYLGTNGMRESDIRMETASMKLIQILKEAGYDYGLPKEDVHQILKAIQDANQTTIELSEQGLKKAKWFYASVIMAPLAWPAIATASTGALVVGGASLLLTGVTVTVNSYKETKNTGTTFMCNFGKEMLNEGPEAFVMALIFTGIRTALPKINTVPSREWLNTAAIIGLSNIVSLAKKYLNPESQLATKIEDESYRKTVMNDLKSYKNPKEVAMILWVESYSRKTGTLPSEEEISRMELLLN